MQEREDAQRIAEILTSIREGEKQVLLVTLRRHDGDGLGCCLAAHSLLERLGIEACLYCPDPVPRRYHFLPRNGLFSAELPGKEAVDIAILLDAGKRERVFEPDEGRDWQVVNIDHHYDNSQFGDVNWVRTEVSSVGEFLPELWEALSMELSLDEATCLYTAVVTDTGSFQFPNTTVDSFVRAAQFAERGVDPGRIANKIFCSTPIEAVRLMSRVLSTTEVHDKYPVAWMVVKRKDLEQTGATYEEMERFSDVPRSVVGAAMGILFVEEEDGMTHVSLRCKKGCDVSRLAARFGGGGHKQASAFDTRANWQETLEGIVQALADNGLKEIQE